MNRRQAKKRMRVMNCVERFQIKPIPHGFWKKHKEIDKYFDVCRSPSPRWKKRLKWIFKQATAEIRNLFLRGDIW